MGKIDLQIEKCKACYYCIEFCPKEAIYIDESTNSKGFRVVKVDEDKCVRCGICYIICPHYVFELKENKYF